MRGPAAPSSSAFSQTSIFVFFKLWKVTHGSRSEFFTFSIGFSRFISLGQHIEVVLMFSTVWVTFILKYSHFLLLFSLLPLSFLAHFRFLHQFRFSASICTHLDG